VVEVAKGETVGILIAVGGTGAKVAEAVVHSCAAGLGPSELLVGFVDQDQGNGNTGRARRAVETYSQARSAWRSEGAHRLDDATQLLAPVIELLSPSQPIWTPHPDDSTTLDRAVGKLDALDEALFNLLFEAGDAEQQMPLGIGYRGRANVGAAAIALAARDSQHPFLKALDAALAGAFKGRRVRLVVTGSLFGGTGAGGFPTLARLLRKRVPDGAAADSFAMAGALMLPYFGFPPPNATEGTAANVARAETFLAQSRSALRYYHRLQQDGLLPFDLLQLTGWTPFFELTKHEPGSGRQENPALVPELVAALGACRFMAGTDPVPEKKEVRVSARAESQAIEWTDLPTPTGDALAPYVKLAQILRFGVAWDYWSRFARSQGALKKKLLVLEPSRHPFYKIQGLNAIDWANAPPETEMQALDSWCEGTLEWARQIGNAGATLPHFRLWSLGRFAAGQSENAYGAAYDALVLQPQRAATPPTSGDLTNALSTFPAAAGALGLGKMVARIHASTAVEGAVGVTT